MTWEQIVGIIGALICVAGLVSLYVHWPRKPGRGISLIVPFRTDNGRREETWNWLREYWRHELPNAQIVIGTDDHTPFCKTAAINNAVHRAKGDIIVILDADCYIAGSVITHCANEIRRERKRGNRLWFVPYRKFYRMTDVSSRAIMSYSDYSPVFFASQPSNFMLEDKKGIDQAHWFGALIQIMPKEAFELVGGMDKRFHGWGGEDVAFMHALDTLYGQHKTTPNGVIHLWHPSALSNTGGKNWTGQKTNNGYLASRYFRAIGDIDRMRTLVDSRKEIRAGESFPIDPRLHS